MSQIGFSLFNPKKDWQQALLSVEDLLPAGVNVNQLEQLSALPIFAVVLVIDESAMAGAVHANSPDNLMQSWIDEQNGWLLVPVKATASADDVPMMMSVAESAPLTKVRVFRYLMLPNKKSEMTAKTREFASCVIDEQLGAYLRKHLKPVPAFNYQVANGEVVNFASETVKSHCVDCHILSIGQVLRQHKLACFDMDSTLICQEVIVELAKFAGVGEQVDKITERAMRGEMDFIQSFTERVGLLAGMPATMIEAIKPSLTPQSGAFAIIATLKALGYHTVLISGGFVPFAKHIAELLGIDEYYANTLDVADDCLTGRVNLPILDGKQKANIVAHLAERMAIDLSEVICIGDGANDLPMMNLADIGIAYHAKPIVQVRADVAVNVAGLEGVLYALGYDALAVFE